MKLLFCGVKVCHSNFASSKQKKYLQYEDNISNTYRTASNFGIGAE